MKACLMILWMALLMMCAAPLKINAQSRALEGRFDAPPPKAAHNLVKRGMDLAGGGRIEDAVATLKKAIAAAPNFVEAHIQYIRLRADFQGRVDEVKAEYEALMTKDPANPVYPMALAEAMAGNRMALYKKVAELAPEWSWGHYANSFVIMGRAFRMMNEKYDGKGEQILAEGLRAIEKDGSVPAFYRWAITIQQDLGRIDDAILTAEKMAARPELRAGGLSHLWRLRLAKAKGTEEARSSLEAELAKLSKSSRDIELLAAVREAYVALLKDQAGADAAESRIRRLDPSWYPERGKASFIVVNNISGLPYALLIANRQFAIYEKARRISLGREPDWRKETRELEGLFAFGPNPALKKFIYSMLFVSARNGGALEAMIKYGEQLNALDGSDVAVLARIALAMAEKKTDLPMALDYARRADTALAEFRPMTRPPDIPVNEFESRFSLKDQQENHRRQLALALDAVGRVLFLMGQVEESEQKLRRSVELNRSETSLTHLAETLRQLGHDDESEKILLEINAKLLESVKNRFVNRPAKDFHLESIDGRWYRLSDLKGKVVLVNFWATWCGPCISEMPLFARIYEKYREQGFELLAISGDDPADRELVGQFAQKHQLNFPVLYDEGAAKLYDVDGYPVSVFIDRQGNVRFVQDGAFDAVGRRLEIILNELLNLPR